MSHWIIKCMVQLGRKINGGNRGKQAHLPRDCIACGRRPASQHQFDLCAWPICSFLLLGARQLVTFYSFLDQSWLDTSTT
jgi:hypothetical protein